MKIIFIDDMEYLGEIVEETFIGVNISRSGNFRKACADYVERHNSNELEKRRLKVKYDYDMRPNIDIVQRDLTRVEQEYFSWVETVMKEIKLNLVTCLETAAFREKMKYGGL